MLILLWWFGICNYELYCEYDICWWIDIKGCMKFVLWIGYIVTPRLLQKGVSENFDFHMTLRHHQSYKLAVKYIFFNDNTSELLTKILQYIYRKSVIE
jgi:hypothetical protein